MQSRWFAAVVLGCSVLLTTPAEAQKGGRRGEGDALRYGWLFSLEQGKAQARETGKPLMVVIRCVP